MNELLVGLLVLIAETTGIYIGYKLKANEPLELPKISIKRKKKASVRTPKPNVEESLQEEIERMSPFGGK